MPRPCRARTACAYALRWPLLTVPAPRSLRAQAAETGLLATSAQQYADAMAALLLAPKAEQRRKAMAAAARASVQQRFSEAAFSDAFCASLAPALG